MATETKDNDTITIYDGSYYEYPKFDEYFKEYWFDEFSEYDEKGHYNGDPYSTAESLLNSYMEQWAEVHSVEKDSEDYTKELELARPLFREKHKIEDITPEEAEDLWTDYQFSEAYYIEQSDQAYIAWRDEMDYNLTSGHFLPWSTYIIQGSETRWNGSRAGAAIWESDAATVGELIKDARKRLLDGHERICVEASRSTGGITVSGSHHDGGSTHTIYAVDERKLVDKEGNRIDLEEYLDLYDMDEADAIGKITISLSAIVDNVYNGTPLDPVFAKK